MRRGNDASVWRDDSGKAIAFNLGADYCAEHEWGIEGIQRTLGIKSNGKRPFSSWWKLFTGKINEIFGIEKRSMTSGENQVLSFETKVKLDRTQVTMWCLGLGRYGKVEQKDFDYLLRHVFWMDGKELVGYWDEDQFFIISPNKEDIQELADAFSKKDISIWVGGAHVFKNGGLIIAINSRLPKDFLKQMEEEDRDSYNLKKAAVATGIYDVLEKAGKNFYALSPRWANEEKTEIKFWLNPQEQHMYNYGWYKVDELKQWAKGEGPIIKQKEAH